MVSFLIALALLLLAVAGAVGMLRAHCMLIASALTGDWTRFVDHLWDIAVSALAFLLGFGFFIAELVYAALHLYGRSL